MAVAGRLAVTALLFTVAAPAGAQPAGVDRGRQLFAGEVRLANGGPPCAACHDTAGLAAPGGGTMGPDLTDIGPAIGREGIAASLETLYFPTMVPLFSAHPLTPDERQALAAFLGTPPQQTRHPAVATLTLVAAAAIAAVVLFVVTGIAGRGRVRSVRGVLLARAAAARKAAS